MHAPIVSAESFFQRGLFVYVGGINSLAQGSCNCLVETFIILRHPRASGNLAKFVDTAKMLAENVHWKVPQPSLDPGIDQKA
jgi:hypothetical protein